MNTLPPAPEEKTPVPLEYGTPIGAFAKGADIWDLSEKVENQTARILTFPPRAKTPEKIIPVYAIGTDIEYKPGEAEMKQNELVGQILDLYNFTSKQEQIANQKSSLDKVENLIETRFHQSMQSAAIEDVKNGAFGGIFLLDPRAKEDFASVFGRSLLEELYKLTGKDQKVNDGLRLFYRHMQQTLLTEYGKALRNTEHLTLEEVDKKLEAIKLKKNNWEKWLYDTVLIPAKFKRPLASLFKAFVENYVVPVWELETAQRKSHEAEVAKSA